MKICHVIGALDPAGGGPAAVAPRIAAAQADAGHDTTILTYRQSDRMADIDKALAKVPHIEKVTIEWLGEYTTGEKLRPVSGAHARRALGAAARSHDVFHMHGVWEPVLRTASLEARRHNTPYVVRPAGMLDSWSLAQRRWKKKIALAMGYRAMLNHAAYIHALNRDEAELLGPLNLRSTVRVIPNGVFLEELEPLPEPGRFRSAHGAFGGSPFILFLSRLHYKKGLDYLGDAFAKVAAQHPTVQLVVAGPDEGAQDEFVAQVERLGVSDRVHLVGPLYGQQKIEALVDADCFCLPSRQEGFSVAITEALACGCAVVITDGCHFPEVAEANAGRVTPLDADRVAEALVEVMGDDALRSSMGAAGAALVRERYTWNRVAEQTVAYYREAGCA